MARKAKNEIAPQEQQQPKQKVQDSKIRTEDGTEFKIYGSVPDSPVQPRLVDDDGNAAAVPYQLAAGAMVGTVAGSMDRRNGEAIGLLVAGAMVLVQLLEHLGFCSFSWTMNRGQPMRGTLFRHFTSYASNNVYLAAGYVVGYALGYFTMNT